MKSRRHQSKSLPNRASRNSDEADYDQDVQPDENENQSEMDQDEAHPSYATTKYVKYLLEERGTLRKQETGENKKIVKERVQQIVKELRSLDKIMFSGLELLYSGSSAEGLKVDKPCEFDVMLVFTQVQHAFEATCERRGGPRAYAKLVRKSSANLSEQRYHFLKKFLDGEEPKFLSSYEIMQYYKSKINEAVKSITKREDSKLASLRVINDCKIGSPAVTISIKEKNKPPIHVDMVLSIEMSGWPKTSSAALWGSGATTKTWPTQTLVAECKKKYHLVAKQCPNPTDGVSAKILWRMSFSAAEKKLLRPEKSGCQKQCLKIAKIILGCDSRSADLKDIIASFDLKINAMHLMAENPGRKYWLKSNLGPRTVDLLKRVNMSLQEKSLKHFFIPSLNLYEFLDENKAAAVCNNLSSIIQELEDDPKEFCENLLHRNVIIY